MSDDTTGGGRSSSFIVTSAGTRLVQSFAPYLYPSHSSSWRYQNPSPNANPIKFESIRFQSDLIIPEPKTYALLHGLTVFAGVLLKRRFR